MNKTLDRAPTLEDFCDVANDLYAAPTEERFLAVVNLARESLILRGLAWDEGYAFGRSQLEGENERLRAAISRALADSESGTGWGPDVTVCAYLRDALTPNDQGKGRE